MMLDAKNISLKYKTAAPIIVFLIIGVIAAILFTGYSTKKIILEQERQSTLHSYRDTVINALTTMMISGNFNQQELGAFLGQMQNIANVSVIRGSNVSRQYGTIPESAFNPAPDSIESQVLQTGQTQVSMHGDDIRGIYPYIAQSNYMGRNCLSCHNVKGGDVLGVVSIKIPLKGALARISAFERLYALMGILGILLAGLMVFIIVDRTHKPLSGLVKEMKSTAQQFSGLDLARAGGDEISRLSSDVNGVIRFFTGMVNDFMVSTSKILPVIDVLKDMSREATEGVQKQSVQATNIAAASEEMSQTISEIARNASGAAHASAQTMKIAMEGEKVAKGAAETAKKVFSSADDLGKVIFRLNSRVNEIGSIVAIIKDIADQTNLLALNAAIEAARAGEYGRGFAVVAAEVGNLSFKTINATKDISKTVESVLIEADQTVKSMNGTKRDVAQVTESIGKVEFSLQNIVSAAHKSSDEITLISTAIEEQSATMNDVAQNIGDTADIAHKIKNLSGNVQGEVKRLTQTVDDLRAASAGVKTKGGAVVMIELAKSDHKAFVQKIASSLEGNTVLTSAQLPDYHSCRFGKWYYNGAQAVCGDMRSFRQVEGPHEMIHRLAHDAVACHARSDQDGADRAFKKLQETSEQMLGLLDRIKEECN